MSKQIRSRIDHATAVRDVREYFATKENGRPAYTGSHFETLGGSENVDPNRITATDLIAVSMLSVDVPAQASLGILETHAEKISELLSGIPHDLKFEDLTTESFEKYLGDGSPADELWALLRQHGDKWDVGQTTASKIIARKRPHLVPVFDSVIEAVVGLKGSKDQWRLWFSAFNDGSARGETLADELRAIRSEADQPHLSLLRVLDIALWKLGKREQN